MGLSALRTRNKLFRFNPDSALDLVVKQNFSINSSAHGKF
ncbi:hypothetical protein FLACOL_01786 [Flavobacterium columnare]|uniref:Uncharacterized protein n=1 Tax=Flavobacterium columnare TaxID=996 RepID=A0A2N9PBQ9_9FLAO|nr:hypothetical protein FLACOL_01786 [Flavobacterium columnare]